MRPPLIAWTRHVNTLARKGLHPFDGPPHQRVQLLAFASDFATGCAGMTGKGITLSAVEHWPARTVSRYLSTLRQAGLVEMTLPAKRGTPGKPGSGRKARYALRIDGMECH